MADGKNPEDAAFWAQALPRRLRLAAAGMIVLLTTGCSVMVPLPSFMSADSSADVTGSIAKPKPAAKADLAPDSKLALPPGLDAADWRVAEPALAQALRSSAPLSAVAWVNPDSGHGGAFKPVAGPFERDGRTCRAFVARLGAPDHARMLQSVGCLATGDDKIALEDVEPWTAL